MLGNNITADKLYRLKLRFTIDGSQATPGTRFYFPETPAIDKKIIVGIEGHVRESIPFSIRGDLNDDVNGTNVLPLFASFLFLTMSDDEDGDKFFNIPFKSICKHTGSILFPKNEKRVYPYYGRIKTRKCFFTFPPNTPFTVLPTLTVSLTFFYNA
jgi:hypothetical protein